MSNDAIVVKPVISTGEFRGVSSFDDAMLLASETFGQVQLVSELLGDGFELAEKKTLVGTPLIILSWNFAQSDDFKDERGESSSFVVARIVTKDNRKVFITDGGAGIHNQLLDLESQNIYGGVYVPSGLRVSEYTYTDEKGRESAASTFYLDTSASE